MSKQTAANVIFISQISEKSCIYGITNFWFSQCDFPLMRVFTSPKMRISKGPPVPYFHELKVKTHIFEDPLNQCA